ncbi:hypothetical protein [Xanthomonas citri]|uniref:hypothetical protein n=1 Tax=Xanthomonas citri TaxID=346 RepID=UPI0010A973FB|nr:hypothetical protein [Xanthomonas citri]WPM75754.1 hypothetical protein XVT_16480 [Xanthomonas citri pv. viticola]
MNVQLNGHKFLFMVHANTNFYAMTTHANAEKAGIRDLLKQGDYGISAAGEKSKLGNAKASVENFQIGSSIIAPMPIRVFEIPQDPPVDGMVGLMWLKKTKAVVDYAQGQISIPAKEEDLKEEGRRLEKLGYIAHKMKWDEKEMRYIVAPKVNGGGERKFVVSTVSYFVIDEQSAKESSVQVGEVVDTYGGPTGAVGDERASLGDIELFLDGQKLASPAARIYDIYAYDGSARPTAKKDRVDGFLGCDFMLANHAIIDFGSELIYFK